MGRNRHLYLTIVRSEFRPEWSKYWNWWRVTPRDRPVSCWMRLTPIGYMHPLRLRISGDAPIEVLSSSSLSSLCWRFHCFHQSICTIEVSAPGKSRRSRLSFPLRLSRILVPCTSLSMMVEKPSSRGGGGTVVRREHAIKRHTPKNAPRTNLIILPHNFQCFINSAMAINPQSIYFSTIDRRSKVDKRTIHKKTHPPLNDMYECSSRLTLAPRSTNACRDRGAAATATSSNPYNLQPCFLGGRSLQEVCSTGEHDTPSRRSVNKCTA